MSRSILERIAQGQEVTKDECLRSLAAHMANLKSLMDRLEKDNELFTRTPTEGFKEICENGVIACQNKQTKLNQITEHLIEKLDENDAEDKRKKEEAEGKQTLCATRLDALKAKFADELAKYNTAKATADKDKIERQENQVVRGSSSVVTAEVKLQKLSLNMNIGEFYVWVKQAEFYGVSYLVSAKEKKIQQQMLLQHLETTLVNMVTTQLTDETDYKEGLQRLKEILKKTIRCIQDDGNM